MPYFNTLTQQYPVSEAQIRSEYPSTSFPTPFVPPTEYVWVFPSSPPVFDALRQSLREAAPLLKGGNYEQAWEVIELDAESIAANLARKAEEDAQTVADKIEQLWQAADRYVTGYISGVAIGILTIGVMQGKPKAQAITDWSNRIWTEYYRRKAEITVDSVLDLDFSSFGPIPHTIPELQAEVFV